MAASNSDLSEQKDGDFSKYLTYAAVGVGSYIAYKVLFGGSSIEYEHRYQEPKENELADYQKGEKYWVDKPYQAKPILIAKEGPGSWKPTTVFDIFKRFSRTDGHKFHMQQEVKNPATGEWELRKWSRKQFYDDSLTAARAFIKLGLKPWESVVIIGFNSPEWFLADMGAIFAGGLAAGIYTTNNPGQCKYIAGHCRASIAVVENEKQLKKFLEIRNDLPLLKSIIIWDGPVPDGCNDDEKAAQVHTWDDFFAMGNGDDKDALEKEMNARISKIEPGMCCSLIYTSGTTGPPKAVMVSHDSITWSPRVMQYSQKDQNWSASNAIVSYLPLSHIAAQYADLHGPISMVVHHKGDAMVTFARPDALKGSLTHSLKLARPTMFFGVPRVWEKIEEKMKALGRSNGAVKSAIGNWAKAKGREAAKAIQIGGSRQYPDGFNIANKLVFSNVKKALGFDRLSLAVTGAAPIKKSTLDYFGSLNINIVEVYGMSESVGIHSLGLNYHNLVGSVGPALEGVETVLLHDPSRDKPGEGEICMRGRHVMSGYMYDPDKSAATIDDEGLLHSGDVGRKDRNGLLYITGRIKELIITAGGENIAPVPIEDFVKTECPAISNFVVIGDKLKYLTALVTLKCEQDLETMEFSDKLTGVALDVSAKSKTVRDAQKDPAWKAYIQSGIDKYNENKDVCVSRACRIQYFYILNGDFSESKGQMTSTMKLKRSIIHKQFEKEIHSMYSKK